MLATEHSARAAPSSVSHQSRLVRPTVAALFKVHSAASATVPIHGEHRLCLQRQQLQRRSGRERVFTAHQLKRASLAPKAEAAASASSPEPLDPPKISEAQLEEDFDLLSAEIATLSDIVAAELRGCSIYLVGMMGSGKSTLGRMLANTLKYAFFDTDFMIEAMHDKEPVSKIFTEYGQDYFRSCESQVIKQLAPYHNLVVSTGGGAVLSPTNWGHMQGGVVTWLNGDVKLLSRRVAKDGVEKRPLLAASAGGGDEGDNSEAAVRQRAEVKLASILAERKRFYENADIVIELAGSGDKDKELGAPTALIMYRLLKALDARIKGATAEREAKKQFIIEYQREADRPPPSMRTMPTQQQE